MAASSSGSTLSRLARLPRRWTISIPVSTGGCGAECTLRSFSLPHVLDFLVIHPFRDGNGRMSRLITLWLLYICGHEVGRYISVEKLIEESKETYYEALERSTTGWHDDEHDLGPWTDYFLGIIIAAYDAFESRASLVNGRGSKRALITACVRSSLADEFAVAQIRDAAPAVSDAYISKVLAELKEAEITEPIGRGRGARWRRLQRDFD
jgi:Fic family protein